MNRESDKTHHRSRVLTHTLMMQRIKDAVDMACELHPEYDVKTLFGREEVRHFIDNRVKMILHEEGAPTLLKR